MGFELRPYQSQALERLRSTLKTMMSPRRCILQASTGAGKTRIAGEMIRLCYENGKRALFLARGRELVHQCEDTLNKLNVPYGVMMAGRGWWKSAPVQISSKDTFHSWIIKRGIHDAPEFDLVVVDECFPAGTLVDGKPIESIRPGEFVSSYSSGENKSPVSRKVTRVFRRRATKLLRLTLADGRKIVSTPSHPIYLHGRGYVAAGTIKPGDHVLTMRGEEEYGKDLPGMRVELQNQKQGCEMLLVQMPINSSGTSTINSPISNALPRVPKASRNSQERSRCCHHAQGTGVLLNGMYQKNAPSSRGEALCEIRRSRRIARKNAKAQSNEEQRCEGKGFDATKSHGVETEGPWRQRNGSDTTGDATVLCAGMDMLACCANQYAEREWIPDVLQDRCWKQGSSGRNRGGWELPLLTEKAGDRPEKADFLRRERVDRVEVLEQGCDGTFGGVCPDGHVYNLEVEDTHVYFANGILVHNCHGSISRTWMQVLGKYKNATTIGLTATPVRGDGRGLGGLYGAMVCAVPNSVLIEQGWLVPTKVFAPYRPDLKKLKRDHNGDYDRNDAAKRLDRPQLVGDIVQHWMELGKGRPTVVFACTVDHALHLRDQFVARGIKAEHVDGTTEQITRDGIIDRANAGEIEVITNVGVLVQGVDIPRLSCCVIARPTRSLGLFLQMIGRTKRPFPGKSETLVIDHSGSVYIHGMPDDDIEWTLDEKTKIEEKRKKEKLAAGEGEPIQCPKCFAIYARGPQCPECGYKNPRRGKKKEVVDGKLVEVGSKAEPTALDKERYWAYCLAVMNAKGRSAGAAGYMFKAKFGHWPGEKGEMRNVPPPGTWKQPVSVLFPGKFH